jgi:hypothetical protein
MLELRNSRSRYAVLLAVSLAFVVLGAFLALQVGANAERRTAGWASVVFFGACAAVFVVELGRGGARLVLSDEGILDHTMKLGLIPWSDIADARLSGITGVTFLVLEMRDPEEWWSRLPEESRRFRGLQRGMGLGDLGLKVNDLTASPQEILAEVYRHIRLTASNPSLHHSAP